MASIAEVSSELQEKEGERRALLAAQNELRQLSSIGKIAEFKFSTDGLQPSSDYTSFVIQIRTTSEEVVSQTSASVIQVI